MQITSGAQQLAHLHQQLVRAFLTRVHRNRPAQVVLRQRLDAQSCAHIDPCCRCASPRASRTSPGSRSSANSEIVSVEKKVPSIRKAIAMQNITNNASVILLDLMPSSILLVPDR